MTVILLKLLPFFLFLFIGFIFSKLKILKKQDSEGMIKYIYYIGIPSLLFSLITKYELSLNQLPWLVVIGYFLPLVLLYFLYLICWNLFSPTSAEPSGTTSITKSIFNKQSISVYAFVSIFSNIALLGVPATQALFGKEGANALITILSFHSLILLSILIVTLEWSTRDRSKSMILSLSSIIPMVTVNPIIMSLLLGFLWNLLGFKIFYPVNILLSAFSTSVAPVALVALGGTIYFFSRSFFSKQNSTKIIYIVILKNFIAPLLVFIFTKYLLHLPLIQVSVATFIASLPSGMNAFIIASQYKTDCKVPSGAIFVTTVVSIFTLPIILLLLQLM